jgi:hypothetical protein
MGRAALPPAKKKAIIKARLEGQSVRAIAEAVDVSKNTVTSVWHDPKNFAVLAAERAKRSTLIGQVLDSVYKSLIRDIENGKGDPNALRVHALDVLARGEPDLRAVLPEMAPGEAQASAGGSTSGMTLQELLLLSVRQGTATTTTGTNGHGSSGNGHSG